MNNCPEVVIAIKKHGATTAKTKRMIVIVMAMVPVLMMVNVGSVYLAHCRMPSVRFGTIENDNSLPPSQQTLQLLPVNTSIDDRNRGYDKIELYPPALASNRSYLAFTRGVMELNQRHAFWKSGQRRFCETIRQVTNVSIIGTHQPYHVQNNLPPPLMRVFLNCTGITTSTQLGTGNWITAIYAIRIAATLGMVDLEVKCLEDVKNDPDHLISWFVGYFPSPVDFGTWPYDEPVPTEKAACSNKVSRLRIDTMAHEIQSEVRKLAVTVLGTRQDLGWSHPSVPQNRPPLVPGVVLDDVVIHLRCGDVFGGHNGHNYGIVHFSEYKKYISPHNTTTLGIVTQPLTKGNFTRSTDLEKSEECRHVVTALVDYLQDYLPNTRIAIRNDVKEPIAVAYARMAVAKQVFVSESTFGIFPAVGTFGEGFFQRGNRDVNKWSIYVPEKLPNVHMMHAPRMSSLEIRDAGLNATLSWLVSPVIS